MGSEALLSLSQNLLRGSLVPVISTQSNLTEDADRQARLEFRLGMVQLEAGEPQEAKRHFEQALEVRANAAFRPVAGFYLEKITGQKLPPLPEPPAEEAQTTEKKDDGQKERPKPESAEPGKAADEKSSENEEPSRNGHRRPRLLS
ncbi:MAG: tetratricopeptide repeat protein [Planctomycetes bacterium]|nr:tetratricopeptide repeat protein [Planctomycetota bacterium]